MSRGQKCLIFSNFPLSVFVHFWTMFNWPDHCKQNLFLERNLGVTECPRSLNPRKAKAMAIFLITVLLNTRNVRRTPSPCGRSEKSSEFSRYYTCRRYQKRIIRNYKNEHQFGSICIHQWLPCGVEVHSNRWIMSKTCEGSRLITISLNCEHEYQITDISILLFCVRICFISNRSLFLRVYCPNRARGMSGEHSINLFRVLPTSKNV